MRNVQTAGPAASTANGVVTSTPLASSGGCSGTGGGTMSTLTSVSPVSPGRTQLDEPSAPPPQCAWSTEPSEGTRGMVATALVVVAVHSSWLLLPNWWLRVSTGSGSPSGGVMVPVSWAVSGGDRAIGAWWVPPAVTVRAASP